MALTDAAISHALMAARALRGEPVTIARGGVSVSITAIPLDQKDDAETAHELIQTRGMRDWGLYVPDLVFPDGSGPEFPERLWTLTHAENGATVTYTILPTSGSDDIHERMTPDETWIRVHTKRT